MKRSCILCNVFAVAFCVAVAREKAAVLTIHVDKAVSKV
jgi:hypothetical protein